jgi:hypothetical protein
MVGFDPTSGNRFSTYARHHADKQMRAALADDPPALKADFEVKATASIEQDREENDERSDEDFLLLRDEDQLLREEDLPLRKGGHRVLMRGLICRRPYRKCYRPWKLWTDSILDAEPRRVEQIIEIRTQCGFAVPELEPPEPRKRNFLIHRRTETELADKDRYYLGCYAILGTYKKVAEDGMEGWGDADDDTALLIAVEPYAYEPGKTYRLPKEVLKHRWKLRKERYENAPYKLQSRAGSIRQARS